MPTLLYLPFAIFNIASPILTVVYGFTNFRIVRNTPDVEPRHAAIPENVTGARP